VQLELLGSSLNEALQILWIAVVVHICNPSTWKVTKEDGDFQTSLGYIIVIACL
jgi:hypothetical protein